MAWVESVSPSFRARHDSRDADDAARVLESLERTRDRLDQLFARTLGDLTLVLHRSELQLDVAQPLLPLARRLIAPAARRYEVGAATRHEIHVLAPVALRRRASDVPGSREMLALAPAALYARRVVAENRPVLPRRLRPGRALRASRGAWLFEGAGRFFAGQTEHARPAIARRLREGARPAFPPSLADASLLGGTVVDLLAREEGVEVAVELAVDEHPQGLRAALVEAFGGRSLARTEDAWRSHLARWIEGAARRPAEPLRAGSGPGGRPTHS